jgi:hypothetical protein
VTSQCTALSELAPSVIKYDGESLGSVKGLHVVERCDVAAHRAAAVVDAVVLGLWSEAVDAPPWLFGATDSIGQTVGALHERAPAHGRIGQSARLDSARAARLANGLGERVAVVGGRVVGTTGGDGEQNDGECAHRLIVSCVRRHRKLTLKKFRNSLHVSSHALRVAEKMCANAASRLEVFNGRC